MATFARRETPELAQLRTEQADRLYFEPVTFEDVLNIVEREKPGGIIGVACHHEMGQAADRITGGESSVPFAYQGVTLSTPVKSIQYCSRATGRSHVMWK